MGSEVTVTPTCFLSLAYFRALLSWFTGREVVEGDLGMARRHQELQPLCKTTCQREPYDQSLVPT